MKLTVLIICCCLSFGVSAQKDLLLLRHKTKSVQTWTTGSYILFQFSSKQWIEGIIKSIKNDSLLIDQIQVRQVGNQFGYPTLDTVHFGLLKLHINEVYALPQKSFHTNMLNNGTLFIMGSTAYVFLNIVNSLVKNDAILGSDNLPKIGIAVGGFILGKVLQSTHKNIIQIGPKYTLSTIK